MTKAKIIRTSLRHEDRDLLTGMACFVDDIHLDGMLEATFVRSQVAHARIRSIGIPELDFDNGLFLAVTASDLDIKLHLPVSNAHPALEMAIGPLVLAQEVIRYIGEPVAMLVARDRYVAEDFAELVDVDTEMMPVCADITDSLAPGAPLVHICAPGNVAGHHIQSVGDAQSAIDAAAIRLTRTLRMNRGSAQPMETRGVVANWDGSKLTVWSGSQRPHGLRRMLAQYLSLDEKQVRVVSPSTGGSFGCKAYFTNEELLVAWASIRLKSPVKWIEDRTEHFLATYPEHLQIAEVECGFGLDGHITGIKVHVRHDLGAYTPYGFAVPQNTMNHLIGPYRIPAVSASFTGVYTNKTPGATFRGAGRPQGVFIIERMMDAAARHLDIDRTEIRRRNLIDRSECPYDTGLVTPLGDLVYDSGDFESCMDAAVAAIDQSKVAGSSSRLRRGFGIANYIECSVTRPSETAIVELQKNGRCSVFVGTSAQGQGHETMLAQVVASVLEIDPGLVDVHDADSDFPESVGTFGSRVAIMGGSAAHLAASELRIKCIEAASSLIGTPPSLLAFSNGGVHVIRSPLRFVSLMEIAASHESFFGPLRATYTFRSEALHVSSGTHAAVVEIDIDRLEVKILDYAIAHNCGVIIDEGIVDGQTFGAFAQGIGGYLFEHMDYDEDGQLLTGSFAGYLLPTAQEVPRPKIIHLVTPSPLNPLGVKGAGEGGILPVAAVIASAIEDALGIDVDEMPLPPKMLHELIEMAL